MKPIYGLIYSLLEKELAALRDYLKENQKKGFIRPSITDASYPILFMLKPGGKLWLCMDYHHLNEIIVKNQYILSLILKLHDWIREAKWFITLDLRGAYNLIRMKEGEEKKTTFRTRYGLYKYLIMLFRLINALATFQSLVNDTLKGYLDIFYVIYLDNILIYSETLEQHVEYVRKVLLALQS
jgi:Reverse transcriptase (RNA-dependent DNA polymerase)